MFSIESNMTEDELIVCVRFKRERKRKSLFFKGMLGYVFGLPPHSPGLGTVIELCWLSSPMAG